MTLEFYIDFRYSGKTGYFREKFNFERDFGCFNEAKNF